MLFFRKWGQRMKRNELTLPTETLYKGEEDLALKVLKNGDKERHMVTFQIQGNGK